jgi:hypothetical protein
MAAKLTILTHKIVIQLHLMTELYHLLFSLQAASPATFGYTLLFLSSLPPFPHSYVQILSSTPCSYSYQSVFISQCETKFHTHTKQEVGLFVFNL